MPKKPNKLLRIVVPLALIVAGLGVLASIYVNQTRLTQKSSGTPASSQPGQQQPEQAPPPAGEVADAATDDEAPDPIEGVDQPEQQNEPVVIDEGPTLVPLATLHARQFEPGSLSTLTLGATDATSPEVLMLEVSRFGMGVKSLKTARHFDTIAAVTPTEVQAEQVFSVTLADGSTRAYAMVTPFAAYGVTVNGQYVDLTGPSTWRSIDGREGFFEAFIVDEGDEALLRIERGWEVAQGSYDLALRQSIENLGDATLNVTWWQLGPIDMPLDSVTYGGDKRRVPFGYLEPQSVNATQQIVSGSKYATQARKTVLGKRVLDANGTRVYPFERTIWPNKASDNNGLTLVWSGMKSRYFAVVAHPLIDTSSSSPDKRFSEVERVDRILPNLPSADPKLRGTDLVIAQRFMSGERKLEAGGTLTLDMGVYAGPVYRNTIHADSQATAAGLEQLIYFSFGGMCAFCTFQWLAALLIDLLRVLHDYVVFDWALAIITLVIIVRTCLHPVTRWSQIRMNRFGKQMQALGPKQQKINEKYKDDPKRKQEEMAKLMREEGINPAGMLGCLPMFMQSPIWIALYATLFFAFDLRHEPAFFGVIQNLVPLNWPVLGHFLGDLSEPDRFVYFGGQSISIPLISNLMGDISSLNILPIFLGIVFYAHQKYMTPPTTATMSPEQQQQQKIMKVMMVVMFPFIMYNAPSGLALYFIANSTLGIFESRHIRNSAEAKGLLEVDKKAPSKPGFLQRMMLMAEEQRKLKAQGSVGMRDPGRPKGPPQRRPKKR